jgi:methyl-accepting chemotaxis protein
MDEVTQQNAALVEEAAAAAESLEEQARGLVQSVSMFRLPGGGGTHLPAVALRDATPKQLPGPADAMDFDAAIKAHRDWKYRLLSFVAGTSKETLDPAVISCDDKCALGKWIYGSCRPAMGGDKRCQGLVTSHANFHRSAGEIVRRKMSGDAKTATQVLKGDFAKYSDETVRNIEYIRGAWSAKGSGAAATTGSKPPARVPPGLAQGDDEWEEF